MNNQKSCTDYEFIHNSLLIHKICLCVNSILILYTVFDMFLALRKQYFSFTQDKLEPVFDLSHPAPAVKLGLQLTIDFISD